MDRTGGLPAREAFDLLDPNQKAKVLALFKSLADMGFIKNREKFRLLGKRAKGTAQGYWEFKSFQDRFLGDFKPGKRFVVSAYTQKKNDNHDPEVIKRAVRVMDENDRWENDERKKSGQPKPAKGATKR